MMNGMQPKEPSAAQPAPTCESWWPSLTAVGLFVLLLLGAYAGGLVLPVGDLAGPDSYMWLYLVETAHQSGEGLFYPIGGMESPRSNAPYGETLHWTLPFFALLYVPAWLGSAMTGASFGEALFAWGVIIGPLLLGATVLTMVLGLDPLLRRGERLVVTLFLLMNAGVLLGFQVARPDHQALSLFLIALAVGLGVQRVLALPPKEVDQRGRIRPHAVLLGVVLASVVWVSVDGLVTVLFMQVGLVMNIFLQRRGFNMMDLISINMFAFFLSVVFMLMQPEPFQAVTDTSGALHSGLFVGLWFSSVALMFATGVAPKWDDMGGMPKNEPGRRFVFAMVAFLAAIPLLGALSHLLHPYSTMDERVREIWQRGVIESVPMWKLLFSMPGLAVLALGPVAAGGIYALWNWFYPKHDALEQRPAWILLAVGIGAYAAVSVLIQQRFFIQANLLAAGPFALLIWRGLHLEKKAMPLLKVLLIGNAFALLGAGLFWLQAQIKPDASQAIAASQLGVPPATENPSPFPQDAALSSFTTWLEQQDESPIKILSFINIGPEIIYRTPHSVVSTPYHRNNAGILAEYDFLTAPLHDLSRARQIARERGIDYVLLRPHQAEENAYYEQPDRSQGPILRDILVVDQPPAWLVEVPLPDHLAGTYRLYRVKQAQLSD